MSCHLRRCIRSVVETSRLSIKVSQEYRTTIENRANQADLYISAYIRYCLDNIGLKSDLSSSATTLRRTPLEQLEIKDNQIEHLLSALDQSQQLQALAESRYQAEQQQLAEMRSRSLFQRLKAVLAANP